MFPAAAATISISLHGLPFMAPNWPNVLIEGFPALTLGSMTVPHPSPENPLAVGPDIIVTGMPNILINGVPAIKVTSVAIHAGAGVAPVMTGSKIVFLMGT